MIQTSYTYFFNWKKTWWHIRTVLSFVARANRIMLAFLKSWSVRPDLLGLDTADIWGQSMLCSGGQSLHCRLFSCNPRFHLLDANSNLHHPQQQQPKLPPGTAFCPLEGRTAPVENFWLNTSSEGFTSEVTCLYSVFNQKKPMGSGVRCHENGRMWPLLQLSSKGITLVPKL